MLEATVATTPFAGATVEAQLSSPADGFTSEAGVAAVVSHALDSAAGGATFSLREPFVCATDAPRPRPPLLRSAPRPRPLPASAPDLPPRETLLVSPKLLTAESFALDFLTFETSPHCVIDPVTASQHSLLKVIRKVQSRKFNKYVWEF